MSIFGGYGQTVPTRGHMANQGPYSEYKPPTPGTQKSGVEGAYGLYNTAVEQNAQDYGSIMNQYKNFNSSAPMQNLGGLAETGGYSEQDKADLRARGVSPIRSIYSSANRDVDRQKAIQGGYSPNYTAVKAKMAREMSNLISDKVTDVNAGIAQNVAQNRINIAPQYSSQSFNPIQGQASLYSSTPGLASTYGQLAGQQATLQNNINQAPAISPAAPVGQNQWNSPLGMQKGSGGYLQNPMFSGGVR